jgi:hypothetical protein
MSAPNTTLPPDPFDVPPSVPSLSFKDAPFGTTYLGKVVRLPSLVQQRDFESNDLEFWPDGQPKMTAVFHLDIPGMGERSVWCAKPSSLFAAVVAAQQANGQRMAIGDNVTVTLVGERPNETNPRLNAAKQYSVRIDPVDAFASNGHAPAQPQAGVPTYGQAQPTISQPQQPMISDAAAAVYAPPTATPAPVPNDQAMALLTQIQGLMKLGLDDAQIRAAVPQATPDVVAAVRAIPQ